MFEFGSGTVWVTPVGGNEPANPTPIEIGTLQDISLDISFDLKMLYGQNQFPESVARGKGKITGKARFGRFNSDLLNQMMFAGTRTVGTKAAQKDEVHALGVISAAVIGSSAGTGFNVGDQLSVTGGGGSGAVLQVATVSSGAIATFTVVAGGHGYTTTTGATLSVITGSGSGTPTANITASSLTSQAVTNISTWLLDLGVRYQDTGVPLIRVASGPTAGQYSVSAGTYTFASGDTEAEAGVMISYLNSVALTGVTQQITNQLMGTEPIVTITFRTIFNGKEAIVFLYSAVIGKLMMASKLDDYTIPEIDFEAFANSAGQVIDFYAAE